MILKNLREDALFAVSEAINAMLPESAVENALKDFKRGENTVIIAIGKAAWRMANAAYKAIGVSKGVVITKDSHSMGPIGDLEIYESGHPIPDERTIFATQRAIEIVSRLKESDEVLFLISGGGSALFEMPLEGISLKDIANVTKQLLESGADITEINTLRKRFSSVKGGRFAELCSPAHITAIVLSDVLGDKLDSIASGPVSVDSATAIDAKNIVSRYSIKLPSCLQDAIKLETPKKIDNVSFVITGSCKGLCQAADKALRDKGYTTMVLTTTLCCEAREAGSMMACIAHEIASYSRPLTPPCALIMGRESVVHIKGSGKGGRNQEMALAAAIGIDGLSNAVFISVGSDGTDGPTDAAGGIVDGRTASTMQNNGLNPRKSLDNNDSFNALSVSGGIVKTGATGTNVNDISILLCG